MSRTTEDPNEWQSAHQEGFSTFDVRQVAYDLVDRKLSGDRRKDARKFIYRCRNNDRVRGLIRRLESLPDLDGAS